MGLHGATALSVGVPVVGAGIAANAAVPSVTSAIHGQDVSSHNENIDWSAQKSAGSQFVYVKATEGYSWKSPTFSSQYKGASKVGLIRGGYHYARPDTSGPEEQVENFLNGGGGWTADGKTLIGLLDIEATSGKPDNYGLTKTEMRTWISGFLTTYRDEIGRRPMLYTNYYWWRDNVGNWTPTNTPLHIANYGTTDPINKLPGNWWGWEMWQYSDSKPFAGDSNVWYGSKSAFARFVCDKSDDATGI
jgi:GH25 family lysozyme M1 (1,4-beta-N-acetylmuramidase)